MTNEPDKSGKKDIAPRYSDERLEPRWIACLTASWAASRRSLAC